VQELLYCLARKSHDAEDTGEDFVGQNAGAAMRVDIGDEGAGLWSPPRNSVPGMPRQALVILSSEPG